MYAVAEENSLGIYLELGVFLAVALSLVVFNDILKGVADGQVPFAVLSPDDVPAIFCSLAQVLDIFLLSNREVFPARDFVSHDLKVSELIYKIVKLCLLGRTCQC